MALYEYQCESCGNRFERIQRFSDPPPDICPKCGKGPVRKLVSSPAFQFKGTGWYVTDYAKKNAVAGGSSSSDSSKESASKESSDSPSKDGKESTKSDAAATPAKDTTTTPPKSSDSN